MNRNLRAILLSITAILGVPAIFALFVVVAYQISRTPFYSSSGTGLLYFVITLSATAGGVLVSSLSSPGVLRRLFVFILYAVPMAWVLFFVGFYAACFSGDCI